VLLLIAEGDPIQRELIEIAMHRLPMQVITAEDGEEALSLYKLNQPDILILDVMLTKINGLEVLQQLRESGVLDHNRVILISALGFPEIVQKAVRLKVKDFLVKPVDIELLVERVRQISSTG